MNRTQLEHQLQSAASVREIMTSMRALSATQLRQGAAALVALREHEQVLARALIRAQWSGAAAVRARRVALIVIGTDQGLCGSLGRGLAACAQARVDQLGERLASLVVVGTRSASQLGTRGVAVEAPLRAPASIRGTEELMGELAERLEGALASGACDGVDVVYTHHGVESPSQARTLAIYPAAPQVMTDEPVPRLRPRSYAPFADVIAGLLLEWSLSALYRCLLEALTSEHSARLRTTDGAIRALDERSERLRIELNHARQEAITAEIQEVISGSEAIAQGEAELAESLC